jgi:hypothetical protein
MRTAARVFPFTVLAFAVLSGVSGCGGMSTAKPKAEAAVEVFHQELNSADFDAIWNGADEGFRSSGTREKFNNYLQAVRSKLGKVVSTTNSGWFVRTFNFKTGVNLRQRTTFEHGTGTEDFNYIVQGDEVKLLGYNVQMDVAPP